MSMGNWRLSPGGMPDSIQGPSTIQGYEAARCNVSYWAIPGNIFTRAPYWRKGWRQYYCDVWAGFEAFKPDGLETGEYHTLNPFRDYLRKCAWQRGWAWASMWERERASAQERVTA